MPFDTTLPAKLQEQLEQATRDAIAGVEHAEDEVLHELPAQSWQEDQLDVPSVPELHAINISRVGDQRTLLATAYFMPDPRTEASTDDAQYLADLGGPYADLSEAIITTLTGYCDAPAEDPSRVFGTNRADLIYDSDVSHDDFAVFHASVQYPKFIERIYTDCRADIAKRLGLPY